jgi:DNA mismatch endonuclease (patch repair protein)
MSRIRSKNTQPEKILKELLTQVGQKYRLHVSKMPSKPDIVITKIKTVIFINGCFWHQHKGCKWQAMPKSNLRYWKNKLKRNVEKQKEDIKQLKKEGWKVKIIWECETKQEKSLSKKLQKLYAK